MTTPLSPPRPTHWMSRAWPRASRPQTQSDSWRSAASLGRKWRAMSSLVATVPSSGRSHPAPDELAEGVDRLGHLGRGLDRLVEQVGGAHRVRQLELGQEAPDERVEANRLAHEASRQAASRGSSQGNGRATTSPAILFGP